MKLTPTFRLNDELSIVMGLKIADEKGERIDEFHTFHKPPSESVAWNKLTNFIKEVSKAKKVEYTYEPDRLKVEMNISLTAITIDFQNKKEEREKNKIEAKTIVETLIGYIDEFGVELFQNTNKEPYARVPIDDEHHAIMSTSTKSHSFKRWLSLKYYEDTGKGVSQTTISDAICTIEAKATSPQSKTYELQVRACKKDDVLWYDIGNNEAVKITPGKCEIIKDVPIMFRQYSHMQPHKNVVLEGDVYKLLPFLNMEDDKGKMLELITWISYFIPNIHRPIDVLHGDPGSAKSSMMKYGKRIIDPSIVEILSFPRDDAQLIQNLAHHYLAIFDNISKITQSQSDILCRAVTGDGNCKRMLYTDEEDIIFKYRRAVIMSGVNQVITQPDLLNRSKLGKTKKILDEERIKSDTEWENEFNAIKPEILGGIFQTLAKAMEIKPTIKLNKKPRMTDFALWGCAIAEAIGYGKDKFMEAYYENIAEQDREALEASLVSAPILKFMEDKAEWKGEPTDLYNEIVVIAQEKNPNIIKNKYFPKDAKSFSRQIGKIVSNLYKIGIIIEFHGGDKRQTIIKNNKYNVQEPKVKVEVDNRKVISDERKAINYIKMYLEMETNLNCAPSERSADDMSIRKTINQRVNIDDKTGGFFDRCYEKAFNELFKPVDKTSVPSQNTEFRFIIPS